jgi:glycosyltransferase involved in cell wall biosynthesis
MPTEFPADITPLVLTFNEAPNIGRTLDRLAWARRIVVVDSFSTDDTVAICRRHPQVDVVQRRFDEHAVQWNFGLDQVSTPWVLTLDADYVLSDELVSEIASLAPGNVNGFFARFTYCVYGRPLRGSLYPPRLVLFRHDRGRYVQDGHTQVLRLDGPSGWLSGPILHDDRKPLDRWFADQVRYAAREVEHLRDTPRHGLNAADRIRRRIVFAPALVAAYTLVWQRLALDGWPGLYYAGQRSLAELLLSLRLIERRLRPSAGHVGHG